MIPSLRVPVRGTFRSASLAIGLLAVCGLSTLHTVAADAKTSVGIVIAKDSTRLGGFAATELSTYLTKLYPSYSFPVTQEAASGKTIVLTVNPAGKDLPESLEGYAISADETKAVILSKSDAGLINGVYGLLEHLGVGFYLSEEILPAPAKEFSFKGWQLRNEPLVKDRFVFNWHNFLSGCTGWDEEQWVEWVERSRKMGYNAIMVHAYFNNPMHTYSFNGVAKRSGYYATSAIGRDWGSVPIDGDIRRLPVGGIFDGPVLGCKAAMGSEGQSADLIQSMMKKVFTHAADRGMGICFAFDSDMTLTFVQEDFIRQMPPASKFMVQQGKTGVPNPDTAEGQAYFTAQIKGLITSYPMLTQIGCWVRGKSWFSEIKTQELPADWQKDLAQITVTARPS